jgi:DNA-binding SARP family transcriptional activator
MSDPGERRIELQILGPVRLLSDGRTLPLKIRKGFALLLLLAIEGSLSRPRLCAWLWPALDESSARRNLRRELVRLRDAGAGAAVRADGDHLHPGIDLGCDLLRAEALLAAGSGCLRSPAAAAAQGPCGSSAAACARR